MITRAAGAAIPSYSSDRRDNLAELWRSRELLVRLVQRNLQIKYQRSVLGFVWTLFNPLLTVAILMVVFRYVVRIEIPAYWAFLLSGYFVFNFALQMLNAAVTVLRDHAQLSKSAAFPAEVLIFAATLSRLAEYGVAMLLVLAALAIFHHGGVPIGFAFFPLLVVLLLLAVAGIVLPLSVISIFFYDVEHALPVLAMMLFYISPVFYPVSMVPDVIRPFFFLNPLSGLISLHHSALYEGVVPPLALLGGMTLFSVGVAVLGYLIFDRYRATCAEVV